ncbi:endonuclease [Colwellia sp. BRX8-9]|uniref:endonuclease n=1 Tax=Colwellia sp. BRX8-9 TaxID=2759831 RepID=UPI0015F4EB33|nr:endonuclease [Colwellia sp. BRX8-9]MBA6348338.1 endonuclease [Colwellia sp. BRX8-9]
MQYFKNIRFSIVFFTLILIQQTSLANNQKIESFSKAKKLLEKQVYQNHQVTLYCAAKFKTDKQVIFPDGFHTTKYIKRSKKIEWEHVVPAENFGRAFSEWRDGHNKCVSSKSKSFKGRRCAEKVNVEYRYMQADMFNLYPVIGAVNALRSNYNFTMLPGEESSFGSCAMKINNRKAEPPQNARGRIARTYLYMDEAYQRYSMSKQQKRLMNAWDKTYPISEWECARAKKITEIQESENSVIKLRCKSL